jgi:very-short-patch-repair endonuclease
MRNKIFAGAEKLLFERAAELRHELEKVKQNNAERQKQLEESGLSFLRFTNNEIKRQPEKVIQQIKQQLQSKIKPL